MLLIVYVVATSVGLAADSDETLLSDVRVVDSRGDLGVHDVWLRGDRIAGIDSAEVSPGARVIDAKGMTVLPGLIDTHVHISVAPGQAWREELGPEAQQERRAQHLRSYLAWGITTILDPGILPENARAIQALADVGPAPDVHMLGPILGPAGGYPAAAIEGFPAVATPADVARRFDEFSDVQTDGVKVTMEDGMMASIWPLHSEAVRAAIIAEAQSRDQSLYIHAMNPKMARAALEMKPHALVHAPDRGGRRIARDIADADVYVTPTLCVQAISTAPWYLDAYDVDQLARTIPADELQTARSDAIRHSFLEALADIVAPRSPRWLRTMGITIAGKPSYVWRRLNRAIATTRQLHRAGVPLVLGSDSGNWPLIPNLLHGPTTHFELSLMARAGLTPVEVIRAATWTPAQMLGIDEEVGSIEPGKRADLVIVKGDPLVDLDTLANPVWVIRAGQVRTPEGWMRP